MSVELRPLALQALDIAKENLARDKYLVAVALLVTPEQVLIQQVPPFQDAAGKQAAYGEVIGAAREHGALAIITINDTYYHDAPDQEFTETYEWGRLREQGAPECIMVTVSGPAIPTWVVEVPYTREEGDTIRFGQARERTGTPVGFLEGWAAPPTKPS